jgi:hypothetical protein
MVGTLVVNKYPISGTFFGCCACATETVVTRIVASNQKTIFLIIDFAPVDKLAPVTYCLLPSSMAIKPTNFRFAMVRRDSPQVLVCGAAFRLSEIILRVLIESISFMLGLPNPKSKIQNSSDPLTLYPSLLTSYKVA